MLIELANLSYPLNVHSLILAWEAGTAEPLHYGHFSHPDEPVAQAQARAVELLCSHLSPGGKILEVGCGFGGLTTRLSKAGYDVTGITPNASQIAVAQSRHGVETPLRQSRLEDFDESEGTWDVLLFHESSQNLPMLDIFERASALLKPEGEILVLDEFACKRTEPGYESLHHKDYFIALAERFGFECMIETDCTTAAAPTLDFLIRAAEKYSAELARETGASLEMLASLIRSNRECREKYQKGRFGYFLLHFKRKSIPPWQLRQIREADFPAVSSLFTEVFGQPLTSALWQWKYGPGRGQAIGLWQGSELLAHYGGIPRQLHNRGELMTASQSCDVMVSPRVRGVFGRKGPFFLTCSTFLEHFVGYGTSQLLAYGFPNDRAFRLPNKLGLYSEPVTRINEVTWTAQKKAAITWTLRALDPAKTCDAEIINTLWQKMSRELNHLVVGVRDAPYWRARYQENPQFSYSIVLVYRRLLRQPLAALVVKREGDRLELLDWVAGVEDLPKVVEAARLLAAEAGAQEVYQWASEPVIASLSQTSPRTQGLNIMVPTNAWTSSPALSILMDKLWLTGGDTDFH